MGSVVQESEEVPGVTDRLVRQWQAPKTPKTQTPESTSTDAEPLTNQSMQQAVKGGGRSEEVKPMRALQGWGSEA